MDELSYNQHSSRDAIDAQRLTPIVHRLLDDNQAAIRHWQRRELHGIGGGLGGTQIVLFQGQADTSNGERDWSLVLKILHKQPASDPDAPHYWRREVDVFRSGFIKSFDCELRTPRCYAIECFDEACWLWLEYIEESTPNWNEVQFMRAARHLGQFNGSYTQQHALPDDVWLSRNWHRRNLQQISRLMETFRIAHDHPLYREGYPGSSHAHILQLWDEREQYLGALDALPQTICHYDAFRRNLLAREHDTVAIDWAFVGIGPLGADLATLLWVSFVFNNLSAEQMDALYEPLLVAYMNGLRDVGWRGSTEQVRMGYAASFPVRVLVSAGYDTLLLLDERQHERFSQIVGLPMANYMHDHVAAAQPVIHRISDEARRLI